MAGQEACLALFKKKTETDEEQVEEKTGASPEPEKAAPFFKHARTVHDSGGYEYAMTLWLQGLRKDPTDMVALEAYMESAANFMASSGGKGATKDQLKNFGGRGALEGYLKALLIWGAKPVDWTSGLKAMELAAKLELAEQVQWLGEKVMTIARGSGKAKKDTFIKFMELFASVGAYTDAEKAGEAAAALDPTDSKLLARVKNMSAERTMQATGFSGSSDDVDFRKSIKNVDKQRELEEEDALVKTEETLDRMIERSKSRLSEDPDDQNEVGKLAKLLLERGKADDEKSAFRLLMEAHKRFNVYRFKQQAGDINLRVARRKVASLRERAAADPGDKEAKATYDSASKKLLKMEIEEFEERVGNYPTDMQLQYELGRRKFLNDDYEGAISHLQRAKESTRIAIRVLNVLAQCFLALGWNDEAEQTYREAIDGHDVQSDDLALELRYGLMQSVARRAEADEDLDAAKEALNLAGKIAMQQIDYKDVRERREHLQALTKKLK